MFIPIEFQKAFQKTQQSAIAIVAAYDAAPPLLCSRFGGTPYWEHDTGKPLADDGELMVLLAQINFDELPPHDELPDRGILQFFIPKNDDYYGADLIQLGSNGQLHTQFWPHPDADKAVAYGDGDGDGDGDSDDNGFSGDDNDDASDLVPIFGAHRLRFAEKTDCADIETIECAEALGKNPFEVLEDVALNEKEETRFYDAISDYTASHGHKLLGYPYFTQGDPREDSAYRLLLQIDTDRDGDNDIMWGDGGVGHLFIRDADLKARRFDRVWFYWDCY